MSEKGGAPMPGDPERRTIQELCDELDISASTVHRYVGMGMPSYLVLGKRVFRWPEVVGFIRAQAESANERSV